MASSIKPKKLACESVKTWMRARVIWRALAQIRFSLEEKSKVKLVFLRSPSGEVVSENNKISKSERKDEDKFAFANDLIQLWRILRKVIFL